MKKTVVLSCAAAVALSASAKLVVEAPGHVYTDREAPSVRGGTPGAAWRLTDWLGVELGTGAFDAAGAARLPRQTTGYFHVVSGSDDATFAVVPVPETRVRDLSSFYGIDSAQSWVSRPGGFDCPWAGGDTFRVVSDLLWRTGLPHVRERLSWREVSPQPDAYDPKHYLYNADLLQARGMRISGMFHDTAPYGDPVAKLPRDLVATYRFAARTAEVFGGRMGDWEFWNEQDIDAFAPEPAWDFAAAMKAAYLGFKHGNPAATVLPGALCRGSRSNYDRVLYANGLADYCEVFNFHTYAPLAEYPAIFAELRAFMQEVGVGSRAVWMTESGTNLEGHSQRDGAHAGLKAHSPEQELIHAEFYPKSQIAFQMEGVARNYFFVFGAYNEANGAKDWGVMRRDGTVKPIYAAMSTMTHELVRARLEGEVKLGDGLKGYLFRQPDGTQTLVFWTVSPVDTGRGTVVSTPRGDRTFELPVAAGAYRLTDLCGRASSVSCAEGGALTLRATRYPAYLAGLHGLVAAVRPFPVGRVETPQPKADMDPSVILRLDLDAHDFAVASQKSCADLKAATGRVRLQVWNLSDTPKTGSVQVAGATLAGLPAQLELPAWGKAECAVELAPADATAYRSEVVLAGTFNGRRTSRLVVPLRQEKNLLARCRVVPLTRANDPAAWARNTSAADYAAAWDAAEQAVRFDLSWEKNPQVDRWFYPVFTLRLPDEDLSGATFLEFEVKSVQNKVENDFATQNLMLLSSTEHATRMIGYLAPRETWETRRIDLAAEGGCVGPVRAFRLGANPKGSTCTFWIRNVKILKLTQD